MRSLHRIPKLVTTLAWIWYQNPDLRLLQLLMNAIPSDKMTIPHLYNLEDDQLLERLKETYARA